MISNCFHAAIVFLLFIVELCFSLLFFGNLFTISHMKCSNVHFNVSLCFNYCSYYYYFYLLSLLNNVFPCMRHSEAFQVELYLHALFSWICSTPGFQLSRLTLVQIQTGTRFLVKTWCDQCLKSKLHGAAIWPNSHLWTEMAEAVSKPEHQRLSPNHQQRQQPGLSTSNPALFAVRN